MALAVCDIKAMAATSEDQDPAATTNVYQRPGTDFRAYVPEKIDYALELGSAWEEKSLYWVAGQIGFHLGTCVFSSSETCQQYFDFIGGVAGRDGLTMDQVMGGLRWQFIRFPRPLSPSLRLFAGIAKFQDDERHFGKFLYGAGYGLTASVHERMDVSFEVRIGQADQFWSAAFIGLHFKMDRWIKYFASRISDLGTDAVFSTGKVIKKATKSIFSEKKEKDESVK